MMAATAIAFCMLLNVSFLAVVASLVGSVNLLKAPGAAEVPIPMAAILWIANVLLARATIRHQSSADARQPPERPTLLALFYIVGSFVSLVASVVLLVAVKG